MEAALIDPRDITWERRDPTYRVYFGCTARHGHRLLDLVRFRVTGTREPAMNHSPP